MKSHSRCPEAFWDEAEVAGLVHREADLGELKAESASYERSDVCAVSAASVIIENVVAFEVATALIDKFGGDSVMEMEARWELFHEMAAKR